MVKKNRLWHKVTKIENKLNNHNHGRYITTPEFNTLAADVFNSRLVQANLVSKTIFDDTVSRLDSEIAENKTKNDSINNKIKEVIKNLLFVSWGIIFFGGRDGSQACLTFQPLHRYVKIIANIKYSSEWKSKGFSDESIKPPSTSDKSLTPLIDYYGYNIRVKFNGSILRQPKVSYTHEKIVNIYIVYELAGSSSHSDDRTLKNCLFGTLTKNADIDKYGYSGYGIGFDRKSSFSFPAGGFGQNVLIFGADMNSSAHIDNKKKDILVLGKWPTQGLEHTLTAEKIYSTNFFCYKKAILLKLALQWSKQLFIC